MQGSLSLVQQLTCRSSQDNGAGLTGSDTAELDQTVFTDDDLFNQVTVTQLDQLGVIKSGHNLTASDQRQSLHTIEISVLDGSDARVSEKLFGPVVDQLTVDKAVDAVGFDFFDFGFHLVLFGTFEFGEFSGGVDTETGTKDLDFVSVHGCNFGNPNVERLPE
jgi:hypothetical protein